MSTANLQLRAHLRHRGLLFWTYFVPAVFFATLVAIQVAKHFGSASLNLWALLALVGASAFFLASSQQEILTRPTFYLLPGLRAGMATNQVRVGLVVGAAAVLTAFALPGLGDLLAASPLRAVSVLAVAILVFALVMLLAMQLSFLTWIIFQVLWLQIFLIRQVMRVSDEAVAGALDQVALWSAAAVVGVFLVLQQIRSAGLHRRVAESPYLSVADIKNTDKVAEFKRLRDLHKAETAGGPRPFAAAMDAGLRWAGAQRRAGRAAHALAGEAVVLGFAASLPRRWWKLLLAAGVLPLFMVMGGFYDARAVAFDDNWVREWFVNLPFMSIAFFGIFGTYLRHPAPGRLWDRGTRRDALVPTMIAMLGASYAMTAVLFAFGHAAAALLPPLAYRGEALRMVAPSWHVWLWPAFCHAVQMLVWSLWRSPRCQGVMQQVGTLAFFPLMLFLRMWYGPFAYPAAIGGTVMLLMALPLVWSWRVMRTDQA